MNIAKAVVTPCLLLAAIGCGSAPPDRTQSHETESPASGNAASLPLASMRDGSWSGREFPNVSWADVPRLLEVANSTTPLVRFPVNPLSSQSQASCREGTMALWMIESVRLARPLGFPSLNPLLLGGEHADGQDWAAISDQNQGAAARAYRAWWQRVAALPVEARRADDPLANTAIGWH